MVSPDSPSTTVRRPVAQLKYELLTLGDELLLGLTANGHLTFVGATLGSHGVMLQRNVTITDEADAIVAQVKESWQRSDVVITTGGLGPTCDDRTREAVADVLGLRLVRDPEIVKSIAARFERLGRKMTDNNLKQADRFEGGEVLPNANGTAPGLWVEQEGKVLCMLPGPPNELQPMFLEQVVPRLAAKGLLLEGEAYVQIRTSGIGESLLETRLQPIFDRFGAKLSIAFCAHAGHVDCRVSSPSGELTNPDLQAIAGECAALLGEDFVCYGRDSLAKVCADLLRGNEHTLAIAETVSGGLLANAFTDICGACKFFAGAVVCYTNEAKMQLLDVPECLLLQHGAVSAENTVAMATGAAETLGSDWAVAITGFAGPSGGTKDNPLGTIFIAIHAPHGTWSKKMSYPGPRATVRQRAVNAALDWLRRELVRANVGTASPSRRMGNLQ